MVMFFLSYKIQTELRAYRVAYRLRRFGRTAVRKTVITNRFKVAGSMVFGWVRVFVCVLFL